MAECHPVAYQWVTEARLRGATVIHIDPRFTRTSAAADRHVPIRAGSVIVFLGALIRHVLENELYFRDYVLAYTNAATLITAEFRDVEDLDGVFSGYDAATGAYDLRSWAYAESAVGSAGEAGPPEHGDDKADRAAGEEHGAGGPALEHHRVLRDETLQDPR